MFDVSARKKERKKEMSSGRSVATTETWLMATGGDAQYIDKLQVCFSFVLFDLDVMYLTDVFVLSCLVLSCLVFP